MSRGVLSRRTAVQQAFVLRSQDMGRRVLSGASFQFLGIVLRTAVTIGSTAILARLLAPSDFGYVSMATVVTELAALFANFGLTNILIQRKRITRRNLDTVFWASLGLGAALALVVFGLSFFAAWLFRDPRVGQLLGVLCWSFVLGSLTTIPWVILIRLMQFRTEFWIQMCTLVIRTSVAIACAFAGMGAWSLVAGALTGAFVQAALGLLAVGYWPRLRFQVALLTSTWRTSGSYFGGGFLFYLNMNLDLVLVGRQLGAESLGYYQNARSLTDEIRARIAIPLQHVLFPAFASVQADPERMRAVFVRSARLVAAVVMPIGIGIAVMAQDLVPVLYGDKWLAMIGPLAMLGVSAAVRASTAIATAVINAQDKVSAAFKYQAIGSLLMVAGIAVALPYGLTGVAVAQMLVAFYSLAPFGYALRLVGLRWGAALQILGPPALACLAFVACVLLLRPITSSALQSPAWLLLAHVVTAAFVYLIALHLASRQYFADFRDIIGRLAAKH